MELYAGKSPESVFPEDEAFGAVDYRITFVKISEDKGWDQDQVGPEKRSDRRVHDSDTMAPRTMTDAARAKRCVGQGSAMVPDGWPEEERGRAKDAVEIVIACSGRASEGKMESRGGLSRRRVACMCMRCTAPHWGSISERGKRIASFQWTSIVVVVAGGCVVVRPP